MKRLGYHPDERVMAALPLDVDIGPCDDLGLFIVMSGTGRMPPCVLFPVVRQHAQ